MSYSNQNNNINNLDIFALFTGIIQILSYIELLNDNTNSELMEELRNQDKLFLEKIIKQNEEILDILKKQNRNVR